jgi:2-oxoglutarate/2-oxoacid ferredoxin oxidoreductase subunit beta
MAVAVALDCSFAARGYAGDPEHLKGMIREAVQHKGFSLLDILQPCVTFNRVNTYAWYSERVYHIEHDYDPEDRIAAFQKSLEWGDRIPIGVIYRNRRPTFEERVPVIKDEPLAHQAILPQAMKSKLEETMKEYY